MPKYWEKKICGIYKITHRESGMCYIGLSVHIFMRWNSHVSAKEKYKIHEAFDQFGINAFRFEVVEECDKKELRKREKHWIEHFDCVWPKGYNMNHGGGGVVKHSEKSKKKTSKALKGEKNPFYGKKHSEETRRKLSEAMKGKKGKKSYWCGKTRSEETRGKISEARKGETHSEETLRKMSEAKKGKSKPKLACPHCGKLASPHMLSRWHGDNCKHRDTTLSPD